MLLDQKRFEDAIEKFDRAIEIEKAKKPPMNVLAMVNKGLTLFQWKNDIPGAEAVIKEVYEADADCEAAVATLAQISLQRGEVERAVELFQRQVELARTETDVMNGLQFMHVSVHPSLPLGHTFVIELMATCRPRRPRMSSRKTIRRSLRRTGVRRQCSEKRKQQEVGPLRGYRRLINS